MDVEGVTFGNVSDDFSRVSTIGRRETLAQINAIDNASGVKYDNIRLGFDRLHGRGAW